MFLLSLPHFLKNNKEHAGAGQKFFIKLLGQDRNRQMLHGITYIWNLKTNKQKNSFHKNR